MSRFTRAVLGAALLAAALPGAAHAATATTSGSKAGTLLTYTAAAGEVNNVRVTFPGARVIISDLPRITAGGKCIVNGAGDAECADVDQVRMRLGDGNDTVRYSAPQLGVVEADSGNDLFIGGLRELTRPGQGVLTYRGGAGTDKVSYATTTRAVNVTLGTGGNDDGRNGEHENVDDDVESIEGSRFNDTITGSNADKSERYIGGGGDDTITGLGGSDVFHEGTVPSGSDTYNGGAGIDLIDYSARTAGVNVTLDLSRNDGASGERDFINPNVNDVFGSNGPDVITGTSGANTIKSHAGDDEIVALGGNDRLIGGPGRDRLFANAGNDIVEAVDNTADHIRCDVGADTLIRDRFDRDHLGCDTVNTVIFGTLGFSPKALTAKPGETARLRLSWTHPESWKQVRAVTLKLRLRDKVVGSITIRPRSERISRAGAVQLVRRASSVSHRGRKVTARLAMRLAPELAGKTLRAEVKAADTRGRKQVERDAGTIRVAR